MLHCSKFENGEVSEDLDGYITYFRLGTVEKSVGVQLKGGRRVSVQISQ